MKIDELTAYKLKEHDDQFAIYREALNKINANLTAMITQCDIQKCSIDSLFTSVKDLSESVKKFEKDLNIRSSRTAFFKSALNLWPILIIIFIFVAGIDLSQVTRAFGILK